MNTSSLSLEETEMFQNSRLLYSKKEKAFQTRYGAGRGYKVKAIFDKVLMFSKKIIANINKKYSCRIPKNSG